MGKSDNASVEHRRARLLELLSEGKTQSQSAEILRSEGYPADRRTIWKDVKSFDLPQLLVDSEEMQMYRELQLQELQELRDQLKNPALKARDRIALNLEIINVEIRIAGSEAAKKSFRVNANVEVGNEQTKGFYPEFARRTMKLKHPESWQRLWDFIDSMPDDYKVLEGK
jgi:hypothetical protein